MRLRIRSDDRTVVEEIAHVQTGFAETSKRARRAGVQDLPMREDMLVPLRRELRSVAAVLAATALIALGLARPSGGALILFAIVATAYAALRYRRAPVFPVGAPLADPAELESPGHLALRVSILAAPLVALLIVLALLGLG